MLGLIQLVLSVLPNLELVPIVGNIEAVEGWTGRGVITLMEEHVDSFLPSQLKLDVLRVPVVLIRRSHIDPSVVMYEPSVFAVDVDVKAPRMEAPTTGIEVFQSALIYVSAVREWVACEPDLELE